MERRKAPQLLSESTIDQLFALIAFAKAPRGRYDSIHHGAKVKPGKKPSQMTPAEISAWIDRTPSQPHVIGNFHIIPSTLLNLQRRLGLSDRTLFSRATQNRMATLLISGAGHQKFAAGTIRALDRFGQVTGQPMKRRMAAASMSGTGNCYDCEYGIAV
ncbi:hypothetical protein K3718_20290 (plasmid) [Leisingera aquaemixtae]|uniref:Uncharacterized protein n=1 Tax=Leisingera aquaemixtae TaxID=1396826 RepID=A0ABY5WQR5_9RHOB|nr:hypothetical protein [Leisingera aquaemixtae]UWQ43747.1 hypothetical protein K3718_20290 [Leisingera aquaemixtae]